MAPPVHEFTISHIAKILREDWKLQDQLRKAIMSAGDNVLVEKPTSHAL
jgi:hypothetical protein